MRTARAAEKTRVAKRARNPKKTSLRERAIPAEKPSGYERATESEKPTAPERARHDEKPTPSERFSSPTAESVKTLLRVHYDYQRERMALDGRLGLKKDGNEKKGTPVRDPVMLAVLYERRKQVLAMEEESAKTIAPIVRQHPMWKAFFKSVCGCGEILAAVCLTEFDIYKAPAVSNLWSFAGLAPGKDRKIKGQKCPYNQFLRSKLCGVLGPSFLRSASPYRLYYDNMRHRLESKEWGTASKNPTDPKNPRAGHQHKAAIRYMVKMFLRDLYVAWRTLEGLPVRPPYGEEYLGQKHSA